MAVRPRPLAARIWAKIDSTTDPDGCWLWAGRDTGYPNPRVGDGKGGVISVARWLMEQSTGRPVVGRVRLRCGNGRCCRPGHMYIVPPGRRSNNAARHTAVQPERKAA